MRGRFEKACVIEVKQVNYRQEFLGGFLAGLLARFFGPTVV